MAIAFTKTGQPEEAIRHYKRALELDDSLVGAHYGVAFLLLKRGDAQQAAEHLRAFLARPPKGPDAERWVRHAETALREIAEQPGAGDDVRRWLGSCSPVLACWDAADLTKARAGWWRIEVAGAGPRRPRGGRIDPARRHGRSTRTATAVDAAITWGAADPTAHGGRLDRRAHRGEPGHRPGAGHVGLARLRTASPSPSSPRPTRCWSRAIRSSPSPVGRGDRCRPGHRGSELQPARRRLPPGR